MRHLHVLQFVHLHVLHTQPLNWEFQPIILFVLFRSSQIIDICIFKTKHDPQLCTHIVEGQTEAEVLAPESVQLKSIINLCGLTCSSLILAKPYFTENHASTCCQGCFISHLVRVGGMGGYLLAMQLCHEWLQTWIRCTNRVHFDSVSPFQRFSWTSFVENVNVWCCLMSWI